VRARELLAECEAWLPPAQIQWVRNILMYTRARASDDRRLDRDDTGKGDLQQMGRRRYRGMIRLRASPDRVSAAHRLTGNHGLTRVERYAPAPWSRRSFCSRNRSSRGTGKRPPRHAEPAAAGADADPRAVRVRLRRLDGPVLGDRGNRAGAGAAHAIHGALEVVRQADEAGTERTILFNLCGHGHFDMAASDNFFAGKLEDVALGEEEIERALRAIEGLPVPA
jgi:hypothetical protein